MNSAHTGSRCPYPVWIQVQTMTALVSTVRLCTLVELKIRLKHPIKMVSATEESEAIIPMKTVSNGSVTTTTTVRLS
jgi:hypothetical protein